LGHIEPPSGSPFDIVTVGRVPFQVADLAGAIAWLMAEIEERKPTSVRLANAYCVALADADPKYFDLLTKRGFNFPDGAPVVWFMNRRREQQIGFRADARRVRGPSFFVEALSVAARTNRSHFFLGASPETLARLESKILKHNPSLNVAGLYSPPFAAVSESFLNDCVERITDSGAEAVWVGLGTPKQDFVSTALAERLGIPCIGVGAAFDFFAGTAREAPHWVQNSGFEWAYRFATEPRRLWKRYVFGNARFLKTALVSRG
jgi:N-acetylglucosaminyldiphosphoundecaprenol N-acetyl-beta-D-mannosaminyltransferase